MQSLYRGSILIAAFYSAILSPVRAEDGENWLNDMRDQSLPAGVVRSDQALTAGTPNEARLRSHGNYSLKMGNTDDALKALARVIELNPNDREARVSYAKALTRKLKDAEKLDPVVFNQCVKQWYHLFRKADFQEDSKDAAGELLKLTGVKPKLLERPAKYLERVLKPESDEPASVEPAVASGSEPSQVP